MVQQDEVHKMRVIVKGWFENYFYNKYGVKVEARLTKIIIDQQNPKVINIRGASGGATGKFGIESTNPEKSNFFLFLVSNETSPKNTDSIQFILLTQEQVKRFKEELTFSAKSISMSNFFEFQPFQMLEQELCRHLNLYCFVPEEWEAEQLLMEPTTDYEQMVDEGTRKLITHYKIEQNHKIVKAAKEKRLLETGVLECEICDFAYPNHYGDIGEGYIEAHHKVPLNQSDAEGVQTMTEDLALLCANCHRMIHRKMREVPDHSYDQLKKILYHPSKIRY